MVDEEKKETHFRFDMALYRELETIAKKELRSANAQAEYFIAQGIELYNKEANSKKPKSKL